jgi:hypothetical protein
MTPTDRRDATKNPSVKLGDFLFEFSSLQDWASTAKRRFKKSGHTSMDTICLDTRGRICAWGGHFIRAEKEGAYPVRVYAIEWEAKPHA